MDPPINTQAIRNFPNFLQVRCKLIVNKVQNFNPNKNTQTFFSVIGTFLTRIQTTKFDDLITSYKRFKEITCDSILDQ